jgi:anti-sigma regulatory factor (Ser/Thr protein kinase)
MTKNIRPNGEAVRRYILENIDDAGIAARTAQHFSITRQAANRHIHKLTEERALIATGHTRNRTYKIAALEEWMRGYDIAPGLAEDVVWTNDILPQLSALPENVLNIWHFAFTEMFNNAIDHSSGTRIIVTVARTAVDTQISILDDGVGIFTKIQRAMNLLDERHAILELSKGKLTTDPAKHTGWGIFFTSRMLENFDLMSGAVYFSHEFGSDEDWILERPSYVQGTKVFMKLGNHAARTTKQIFDKFRAPNTFGFQKTIVPVKLAQYGNDQLISRSQAKRVLARVELFDTVLFDFCDVPIIGQAFADEIFRVFALEHPTIKLVPMRASTAIRAVIAGVRKYGGT